MKLQTRLFFLSILLLAPLASLSATEMEQAQSISLLGSEQNVTWERTKTGITITPPAKRLFEDPSWPVIFKIETM